MTNEEKFKNRLTEAFDEPHYEYDAGNWEKASDYLDKQDEKKKRRFLFWLLSGLGLGVLMTTYLLLFPQQTEKQLAQSENKILKTEIKDLPEIKNEKIPEKQSSKISSPITINATPVINETVKELASSKETKEEPNSEVENKMKPMNRPTPKQISAEDAVVKAFVPSIISTPKEKKQTSYAPEEKKSDKTLIDNPPEVKSNPQAEEPAKQDVPAEKNKMSEEKTPFVNASEASDTLNRLAQNANDTIKEKQNSITKKDSLVVKPDTAAASQSTLPIIAPSNYFYAEAGTFLNFGWKSVDKREAVSLNPYFGLTYLMRLTDKTGFSIGGYYTTISNLYATKIVKATRVVFGEESQVTAITPTRLNYISVPVKIQYTVDTKQIITIGYTAGYLLDVQSKVEKYTERLNEQLDKTSYKTGGYTEGFKTFNSQLSVGYRRTLYKKLLLNAEIFYGLTDLRDDTFFGLKAKERNSGIKISLTYDLIKK